MPASPADSSSLLVIIAIICLTMGYVFGWLISSLQHSKEDKKAKVAEPADTPVEAEAGSEKVQAAEPFVPETPAAFFQLREGSEGLMVSLGGKTVSDAASLTIHDRAQIESALRKTATWMGLTYRLGEPVPAPPVVTAPVPAAAPIAASIEGIGADLNEPPKPVSVISGVTKSLADALTPTVKKESSRSIVEQIDEILQAMLAGTPYENQKIYLAEDPKKGVIVRVGTDVYEGVNAVPEGEIKKILRTAVAEWERRQEKNRRRQTA